MVSPHDTVNIQFTSGSTGLPKAVALSHHNLINCGRYIAQQVRMKPDDRTCLPVPLFHSFGMIVGEEIFFCLYGIAPELILSLGISTSLVAGSCLILPHETFNAAKTLECITRYTCTGIYGVPTMFVMQMALDQFKKMDRSSVR